MRDSSDSYIGMLRQKIVELVNHGELLGVIKHTVIMDAAEYLLEGDLFSHEHAIEVIAFLQKSVSMRLFLAE